MMLSIEENILSWILFLPLIGAGLVFFFPGKYTKILSLSVCLVDFVLSLHLPFHFENETLGLQFVEKISWIPSFGISYGLGVDGISLWLILLTTFLGPLVILSAWNAIETHSKAFFAFLLMLQTGMLGAFMASDLFLFYIFWEVMLIPMYFLIGIWGSDRKIYATMKFFLYTMVGSLFMLVGIISIFILYKQQFGHYSADIQSLYNLIIPHHMQVPLFAAFAISFAIKFPVFLLHTWLPDAHVEAPTAGSVILAGVLLKMGGYGFLRIAMPIFPLGLEYFTPLFLWLAVLGIVYGALVAMVQPDIKKLVAYSSVSHLGFVLLGLFVFNLQGIEGGIYQMLSHGLSTGGLFLMVGMLYERKHSRQIKDYGGIAKVVPLLTVFFMIITLSSIGLPGLNGFVGEFLILLSAFRTQKMFCVIGGTGIILGAIYMLWMVQRVFFGSISEKNARLKDLSLREVLVLIPILIMIVFMGVYPKPFLKSMDVSVRALIEQVNKGQEPKSTVVFYR